MKLTVTPADGLVDEAPSIRIADTPPGADVELQVATTDAGGHRWRSSTKFRAGEDGIVDPSSEYEPSLRDGDAVERARIEVERIRCPLLLVSGDADEMWPASRMAESILARRNAQGLGSDDQHLRFPEAGHFARPPIIPTTIPWSADLVSGGSALGNARAQAAAWSGRLEFLNRHLHTVSQ